MKLKKNKNTSFLKISNLKRRVRESKKSERLAENMKKGAELESKGRTILGNRIRAGAVAAVAYASSKAFTRFLAGRLSDLQAQGKYTEGHKIVAGYSKIAVDTLLAGATFGYAFKQEMNNRALKSHYLNSGYTEKEKIRKFGSTEYKDVMARKNN